MIQTDALDSYGYPLTIEVDLSNSRFEELKEIYLSGMPDGYFERFSTMYNQGVFYQVLSSNESLNESVYVKTDSFALDAPVYYVGFYNAFLDSGEVFLENFPGIVDTGWDDEESEYSELFCVGKYQNGIVSVSTNIYATDAMGVAAYQPVVEEKMTNDQIDPTSPIYLNNMQTISANGSHVVGLKSDGSVVADMLFGVDDNGECEVDEWAGIISICTGSVSTFGIKNDGSVITAGYIENQAEIDGWSNIVAVSSQVRHIVGLKSDGTVVAVGSNNEGQCEVNDWSDIIEVGAGEKYTVGLKSDGSVVAVGENDNGQCDVDNWTDIVSISTGGFHTVGLKSDGSVVAVGDWSRGQCDVNEWTDIVAVSAGAWHTIGLKRDGTVVIAGQFEGYREKEWTDIVAVSAGAGYNVGLKADGTMIVAGYDNDGHCVVDEEYMGIMLPGQLSAATTANVGSEAVEEKLMIRFMDYNKGDYEFYGIRETNGGYLVRCKIYDYVTISLEEYNVLKEGGRLDIGSDEIVMIDGYSFESIKDGFGYDIGEIPTEGNDVILTNYVDNVTYESAQKEFFISDDAIVKYIVYTADYEYVEESFSEYISHGGDFEYGLSFYGTAKGDEITYLEEEYMP